MFRKSADAKTLNTRATQTASQPSKPSEPPCRGLGWTDEQWAKYSERHGRR